LLGGLHKKEDIIEFISDKLALSIPVGKKLFRDLSSEGYLEVKNQKFRDKNFWVVQETEKGRHLGVTRANPPISRAKAELLLHELLERVKEVNRSKEYVYKVVKVGVFGSYLTNATVLGDLDVGITLERKAMGNAYMELSRKRIAIAFKKGRRFSNYIEELDWPRREVLMHLSTRKKGLSMHIEGDDEVLKRVDLKIVYQSEVS
jgi:predicted nucleotidyltransferase